MTTPVQKNFRPSRHQQSGMGMWSWLMIIAMIVTLATAALRLGPHYIDFRMLQGVADRLPSDMHSTMSRKKITEHFQKQLRVENFRTPVKELMTVERNREETILNIEYERREHLMYNIDVVLVFSDQRIYK